MDKQRDPDRLWEEFFALNEEAPNDFECPEPLPDAPHRDRVIDEWVASTDITDEAGGEPTTDD